VSPTEAGAAFFRRTVFLRGGMPNDTAPAGGSSMTVGSTVALSKPPGGKWV
jgi:hypothetical protein